MVIAIIAILIALLLPALGKARSAGRGAACLSNHRQNILALKAYADEHKGRSPALGQPYTSLPNWSLVIQQSGGLSGQTANDLLHARGVLACPSVAAHYSRAMTRTYAINVTGHAGVAGADPDNYDAPGTTAHVRVDLVARPDATPALLDSLALPVAVGNPPPTRSASVIDFRLDDHAINRLGGVHGPGAERTRANPLAGQAGAFETIPGGVAQAAYFDGSARGARAFDDVPALWREPLP